MTKVKPVSSQVERKPDTAAPDNTGPKQKAAPFKPGQSGNPAGRPKGSRNKLGEDFIAAMCDDFARHGADVIEKVRQERPADYLRVVAGLLPKELKIDREKSMDEMSDAELMAIIRGTADACGLVVTEADDDPPGRKH